MAYWKRLEALIVSVSIGDYSATKKTWYQHDSITQLIRDVNHAYVKNYTYCDTWDYQEQMWKHLEEKKNSSYG